MAVVHKPQPSFGPSSYSQGTSPISPITEVASDLFSSPSKDSLSAVAKTPATEVNNASLVDPEKQVLLPPKRYNKLLRHVRHTFLNVYRRLFSIVFILNMIFVVFSLVHDRNSYASPQRLANFAAAASANIMIAILIRQDYVINGLFK